MTLLRHLAAAMAVATGMAMAFVALATYPAGAETDVDVSEVCSAPVDGSTMRIDLLVLLDVSGSLRSNDPDNLRISGTKDAIVAFDDLSGQFDNADVRVAIDNFETDYSREQGWTPADGASTALLPRIDSIGAIPAGQTTTDYTEALAGAWRRLDEQEADCRLLVWFTDGEHVTVAPADEVVAEEWAELGDLCDSPAMHGLRGTTWVGAVRLAADDSSSETLRYLFGETGRTCANPLRGEVYDGFDPADLRLILHDIIAGAAEDVQYAEDQDKLPGERNDPPADDEYETCQGGTGTGSREQPCTFTFLLDSSHESFRAFIDLTFLGRGVRNPRLVHTVLRSPSGPSGTAASPTIGSSGEIDPAEADGAYLPVLPFWFYTRAQYGSEIQIVGHQAAEQLTNPNQWQWQWEGEWALLFFGDTPAAQADARSVATAVRVQRDDSPFIDSFGIDDQCNASGFVANYPSEDYPNVELQLHVDAGDGQPVYPTRASLTGVPLDVAPGSRRFAIEGVFAELVAWDSPEGGGNGTNLRNALAQRDGIELVAVLSQTFEYAGAPEPLVWTRDIGRLELTPRQESHLLGLIDGTGGNPLVCLPPPDIDWLPTDVAIGEPEHDWGGASVEVSAVAGEFPATLSLAAEGVERVEDSGIGAAVLSGVEIDNEDWSCQVPAAAGESIRFTCPEPITIEVSTEQPLRSTIRLSIPLRVAESSGSAAGFLERHGYEADSAGYAARSEVLADALSRERRSEWLTTELGAIIDPNAVWRPSDFQMEAIDPPDLVDVKSILVSASPGWLPAFAELESVRFVQEPDGASREAGRAEISPWTCAIPGSESGGGRFPCAEPITVQVPPDRDVELSVVPTLCAVVESGAVEELLERSGVSEGTPDFETLRRLISEAAERERACAEATTSVPPTPSPVWETFLPMLAVLVAAAAAARVLIAWRLRPWQPIGSPDYAVVPLDSADIDGVSVPAPDASQICMDLQQRKSTTSVEGLTLRSRWMPLLRGGEPELRASSASGDCIGPGGHRRLRHGRAEAVVGTDLVRGWIVHDTGHDPRLIVWDLPFDDDDTRRARIIDAERDAALAWERYRASVPAGGPTSVAGVADSAESEPTARLAESDPALQDPFADDSSGRSGDNGPDLDDADPFGRDS
jgi:hypothetical protein